MKRWPLIRHLRYCWHATGVVPGPTGIIWLTRIWRGEA